MSDLRPVTLKEFLGPLNVPSAPPLPLIHTTESFRILNILQNEKLFATPCNIFKGDNLCYFFVGRPAYKFSQDDPNPYYWQLPLVFVLRFDNNLSCKRILPFDSGAFRNARLPSHILNFDLQDYELGPDQTLIPKVIGTFFGSNKNYFFRKGRRPEELEQQHLLTPMHMEVLSLAQMYTQPVTDESDDRCSTIEIQVDSDYALTSGNLLGIILPEEFKRATPVMDKLNSFGCEICHYELYPLRTNQYFYAIYQAVDRILRKAKAL